MENNPVLHDVDVSFSMLRWLFSTEAYAVRQRMEEALQQMRERPSMVFFVATTSSLDSKDIDSMDFRLGMLAGVTLALASAEDSPASLREFLKEAEKQGHLKAASIVDELLRKTANGVAQ